MIFTPGDYEDAVREVLSVADNISAAVAFWGYGSERLIQGRNGTTRLICNLGSGACNPDSIEALNKVKRVELRQNDLLHAKVLLSATCVLVGSANMSSNGLGFEGEESATWREAGILIDDANEIRECRLWFETLWKESRPVTANDIKSAWEKWEFRRANRFAAGRRMNHKLFDLQALPIADLRDRQVVVAIYRDWISDEAKQAYRVHRDQMTGTTGKVSARLPPMYEGWPELPREGQIVDVYYGKRSVHSSGAFTRLLGIKFKYKNHESGHLTICRKDTSLLGLRFNEGDAKKFADTIKPHIRAIWERGKPNDDDSGRVIPLIVVAQICG